MPINVERIQALCFDIDGTLCDTDDMYIQRLVRLLHPLRFLFPGRFVAPFARRLIMCSEAPGNHLIGVPDILGLDDELARLVEWLARRRPRPLKHFLIIPGVQEMLTAVASRYPMAVVSARDDRTSRAFLEQFGLTSMFQSIVTAQTAPHTKPFPDPILHAAAAMGVPPEACLMIGDTTVDIRAGQAAGAQTIGVLCGFGEERELRRRGANMILTSTAELHQVLLPL